MIFLENTSMNISHLENENVIYIKYKANPLLEEIKEGLLKSIDLVVEKEIRKWLSDNSMLEVMNQEAYEWWIKEWLPLLRDKTKHIQETRYAATILSSRFYAEWNAVETAKKMMQLKANDLDSTKLTIDKEYLIHQFFKKKEEALGWLNSIY